MPVKGVPAASGSIPIKIQETITIYLAKGIAFLTTWNRTEPIKCYPGTSAVVPATRKKVTVDGKLQDGELLPDSGWLVSIVGDWTADAVKADTKNRDVYQLDIGAAKFASGEQEKSGAYRSHVSALPGTTIVVAEGEDLKNTVGKWVKLSGKVAPAEPVETTVKK